MTHKRKTRIPNHIMRTVLNEGAMIIPREDGTFLVFKKGDYCAVKPHPFVERYEMSGNVKKVEHRNQVFITGEYESACDYHDRKTGDYLRTSDHPISLHLEEGSPHWGEPKVKKKQELRRTESKRPRR